MSDTKHVRAVGRAFRILQTINQRDGVKAGEIAEATGYPRATVYRLLETMEELRFVTRDRLSEKWRVALHAKSLSSGFRDADWVCHVVVPAMVRLGKRILWPVDLMVPYNDQMEVRESTYYLSPYALDRGMVGTKLPMIETASGRAYLAFSPPNERDKVLQGLKYRQNAQGPLTSRDGELDTVLDQSRKLGVGFRKQGFRADTMSMSAPIYHGQSVIACLTVIWLRSALSFQDAVESYKQLLIDTATDLSRELAAGDYDLKQAERGPDILRAPE